ncbi:MAG: transposase [Geobacteraceae bacterium]
MPVFHDQFLYDPQIDMCRCPAGQLLKRKSLHKHRESCDYPAPKKVCAACELREQCTKNKTGRTVKCHLRQDELNTMRERSKSAEPKRDIKTRQHLMERSFARSTRYDFDQARWRGLWKMKIQEYLTCATQNIQTLIKYGSRPQKGLAARVKARQMVTKTAKMAHISPKNAALWAFNVNVGLIFQRA